MEDPKKDEMNVGGEIRGFEELWPWKVSWPLPWGEQAVWTEAT